MCTYLQCEEFGGIGVGLRVKQVARQQTVNTWRLKGALKRIRLARHPALPELYAPRGIWAHHAAVHTRWLLAIRKSLW
jgi:hypothetical protein